LRFFIGQTLVLYVLICRVHDDEVEVERREQTLQICIFDGIKKKGGKEYWVSIKSTRDEKRR
jgi:hypothetical protein